MCTLCESTHDQMLMSEVLQSDDVYVSLLVFGPCLVYKETEAKSRRTSMNGRAKSCKRKDCKVSGGKNFGQSCSL